MKIVFTGLLVILLISNVANSQTWEQKLNGRSVWSLAKDSVGNIYAGGLTGTNSRIWKSSNGGISWDTIHFGAGQTMWDFAFDSLGAVVYVANFSAGLLKSTNHGTNFILTPVSAFNNKNFQGVECGKNGHVFVTTSMGFFRSTNYGQTFTETALTGLNCLPVLVDKDSSNIVYAGVSSAGGTGIGVYRSTDNGLTFSSNLNPGKNGYNLFQKDNGKLYMITTTAPYNFDRSTNKGLTWNTISNTAPSQRGITYSPLNGFYTAGNGGVFRSTNNGLTFENLNFTTSATPILSVQYMASLRILAGTSGAVTGGVWIFIEGAIQNISNQNENTTGFKLFQNYPNPFNPGTTIKYELTGNLHVTLKVFDILGNEVATLVNEKQNAGSYGVEWPARTGENTSDFPSGIYYYSIVIHSDKVQSKNSKASKKMLLIK